MNIKNNKGYVAADATIAIIILLILIPTIAGMMYNITRSKANNERKVMALNIAVNTIESAKEIGNKQSLFEDIINKIKDNYKKTDNIDASQGTFVINENNAQYKVEMIKIEEENQNKIIVTVKYHVGGKEEKIELSTAIA